MAKGASTPKVKRRDEENRRDASNLQQVEKEVEAFGSLQKEEVKKVDNKEEKAAAPQAERRSEGMLASIRPHRRPLFPIMFVLYCLWVALASDHCNVRFEDKQNCGSSGMSFERCLGMACFLKDGGPIEKSIKIKEVKGQALGLSVTEWQEGIETVDEILDGGLVHKYNLEQPIGSEAIIRPGDRIEKALTLQDKGTMTLTVWRSRLPHFFARVLGTPTDPKLWEKILSAPGTQHLLSAWLFHLPMGLACWLVSGYGLASIPVYMISTGGLAFELTRCCHTSHPAKGQPHCFVGDRSSQFTVLDKAVERTKMHASYALHRVRGVFDQLAQRAGYSR